MAKNQKKYFFLGIALTAMLIPFLSNPYNEQTFGFISEIASITA